MSLLWSYWDVAPLELLGWRSYGAIGMSLLWSYWDVAPLELLGWRSYGAIIDVQHQRCDITINIDGKKNLSPIGAKYVEGIGIWQTHTLKFMCKLYLQLNIDNI
jgi:hypothetical protein